MGSGQNGGTMMQCHKCHSTRVVQGGIECFGDGVPGFTPKGLGFVRRIFGAGSGLDEGCYACLDCGLIWGQTSTAQLNELVGK